MFSHTPKAYLEHRHPQTIQPVPPRSAAGRPTSFRRTVVDSALFGVTRSLVLLNATDAVAMAEALCIVHKAKRRENKSKAHREPRPASPVRRRGELSFGLEVSVRDKREDEPVEFRGKRAAELRDASVPVIGGCYGTTLDNTKTL